MHYYHCIVELVSFDNAFRPFLTDSGYRLPKEAPKIERLLIAFSKVFIKHNPHYFPGEYLDHDTLESIPAFWFKKFGWIKADILKLYKAGQLNISKHRKR